MPRPTPAASAVGVPPVNGISVPYPWLRVERLLDTSADAAEYRNLPRDRTVIVGSQVEV